MLENDNNPESSDVNDFKNDFNLLYSNLSKPSNPCNREKSQNFLNTNKYMINFNYVMQNEKPFPVKGLKYMVKQYNSADFPNDD